MVGELVQEKTAQRPSTNDFGCWRASNPEMEYPFMIKASRDPPVGREVQAQREKISIHRRKLVYPLPQQKFNFNQKLLQIHVLCGFLLKRVSETHYSPSKK
jgi:hypothetical protein